MVQWRYKRANYAFLEVISMVSSKSYVRITDDKTEAWLYLSAPEDEEAYEKSEIIQYLHDNKVVAGLNESNVAAMCKKRIYEREVKVATSEKGEEGCAGRYEFFFDTEKKKPEIRKDGSVDYRSMSLIQNVEAGDLLARYYPAVQGRQGRDVTGAVEKALNFKDLRPLTGKGISNDKDPNEYYATKSGKVEYDGGNKLSIVEVYEISGDCDLANNAVIEFNGDVVINGNVEAGVIIRAGKSLTVEGGVESATISAGGDVCLKRGMQGAGKGSIVAGGDVFTEFIEYANVKAGGNIQSNVILSSRIEAGNSVILTGKKGLIAGGNVHGMLGISCMTAGNMSEIKTQLHVGLKQEMADKRMAINAEYDAVSRELEEIVGGMAKILRVRQQSGELSEQLQTHLAELKQKKDELYEQCTEIKKQLDEIEHMVMAARDAKIKIAGNIYHGVVIGIDSHEMPIIRDTSFMEYKAQNGIIVGTVMVI